MMSFIEMNLYGSVLILIVVLIRFLFKNKLPKRLLTVLWSIVALRFILPFRIQFFGSFYEIAKPIIAPTAKQVLPGIMDQTSMISKLSENNWNLTPYQIIWIIGICVVIGGFVYFHNKTRFTYKVSLPVRNEFIDTWLENDRLRRPIQVRYSDRIGSPFTTGILWPMILLPKTIDWNDRKTLMYVLAHEKVHIKRFDVLIKWVFASILCVYWFNPLVWLFYKLANQDLELSCDESVILNCGLDAKSQYASVLVEMEERRLKFAPLAPGFSKSGLQNRIVAILQTKKISVGKFIASMVAVAIVVALFFTNSPLPKDTDETQYITHAEETEYQYTEKELNEFLKLTHYNDYQTMSISKFNSLVYKLFEDDSSGKNMELFEKVLYSTNEEDSHYSFVRNTIQSSLSEYYARLEEVYSNDEVNPTYWINLQTQTSTNVMGVQNNINVYMDLTFSYRILDETNLTVKERDDFIQAINKEANSIFIDQINTNGTKEMFIEEFKNRAALISTDKIVFVECVENDTEIYN